MARRKAAPVAVQDYPLPPLPIDERSFRHIARKYRLSPMHTRIVDLLLRGLGRKQIEDYLPMPRSTLDTHMGRIFRRLEVGDHVEVILLVTAEFNQLVIEKLGSGPV